MGNGEVEMTRHNFTRLLHLCLLVALIVATGTFDAIPLVAASDSSQHVGDADGSRPQEVAAAASMADTPGSEHGVYTVGATSITWEARHGLNSEQYQAA